MNRLEDAHRLLQSIGASFDDLADLLAGDAGDANGAHDLSMKDQWQGAFHGRAPASFRMRNPSPPAATPS